jgi:hypothetical protein
LNTDVKSVEGNLQALKEIAKKNVLDETKGVKDKAGLGADNGGGNVSGSSGKGMWDSAKDMASKAWDSAAATAGKIGTRMVQGASMMGNAVMEGASNIYGASKSAVGALAGMVGGAAVNHPGKGTGGDVNALPMPQGQPGSGRGAFAPVKDLIMGAAKMAGVDDKLMATMAAIESGFNWSVKAGTSSATGLYQFISSTWKTMLKKYGPKYGISPDTPATDPRANALMGAEFLKENAEALKGAVNRPLTDTDLYIAHFMGAGGAKKFLTADPSAIAANLMPEAARANKSIFYSADGRPLTVSEVYQVINGRVRRKGKEFGLDSGPATATAATSNTPSAPAGAAGGIAAMAAGNSEAGAGRGSMIPVSDQSAGVSSMTASDAPATGSSRVDPSVAASAGGFSPTSATPQISERARDLTAQNKMQRDAMSEVMGSVDTTLQKSMGIQQEQLSVLKLIFQVVKEASGDKSTAGQAASTDASSTSDSSPRPPMNLTRSPVSMGKPAY